MFASVIIPTHNRRIHVLRAVAALMEQNYPRNLYDVIVCCDRCTDGTEEALRTRFNNDVEVIQSTVPGQAAALNTSWRHARGELAIMLDDEMEAVTGFITAHVIAHRSSNNSKIVVTGYSPAAFTQEATPIIRQLSKSFEDYFRELSRDGHESAPIDLCGCNFSIPIAGLREVEGFREGYLRNDFELAVRLLEKGYELRFSQEARAYNWIAVDADTLIGRAAIRAREDYRFAREHPWCTRCLQFYRPLCYAAPRRRWRLLWEVCGLGAMIVSFIRRFSPDNLRLINTEYVCRYCLALKHEVGNWQDFCRLAELIEAK